MCGIAGVASVHGSPSRDWLENAAGALRHRGPDDSGQWWSEDGTVGLAQTRLAIIDLSPAGHQPMLADADGLALDSGDAGDNTQAAAVRNSLRDELSQMMSALQFQDIESQ